MLASPPNSPCMRLLVVEDNAGDLAILRRALETLGIQPLFTVVDTGEEALALVDRIDGGATELSPELVVLDLGLPACRGNSVLRAIRRSRTLARVPVAVFTGSDSPADRVEAAQLGAERYLVKPCSFEGMVKAAEVMLDLWLESRERTVAPARVTSLSRAP